MREKVFFRVMLICIRIALYLVKPGFSSQGLGELHNGITSRTAELEVGLQVAGGRVQEHAGRRECRVQPKENAQLYISENKH